MFDKLKTETVLQIILISKSKENHSTTNNGNYVSNKMFFFSHITDCILDYKYYSEFVSIKRFPFNKPILLLLLHRSLYISAFIECEKTLKTLKN